jgi:hypothetical protein
VFAQAVNVERLLNMLRALDPSKGDNLADDEEIQVGVSMLSIPTAFFCIPLCVHHYFFWTSSTIGFIAVTDAFFPVFYRNSTARAWRCGPRLSSLLTSTARSGVRLLFLLSLPLSSCKNINSI